MQPENCFNSFFLALLPAIFPALALVYPAQSVFTLDRTARISSPVLSLTSFANYAPISAFMISESEGFS